MNASTRPGAQETTGLDGASELLTAPQGFRERLDGAMRRRQGALIDLTGAILTAGPIPSPVHVSLAPACRRGWVSLYAALAKGQIDGGDAREVCSHLTPRPTVATGRARLRSA